jgi:phospholipase C
MHRAVSSLVATLAVMIVIVVGASAPVTAATGSHASLSKMCGSLSAIPSTYAHVIWIWMENHSESQIIGPPGSTAAKNSPYVNGTLVAACGLATNYHNITHPSLPNYLAATSGSTQGLTKDCLPAKCSNGSASLFGQLKSWRAYEESMPSNCFAANTTLYAPKHNPPAYYKLLGASCQADDVPLGALTTGSLAQDLAKGTLPSFSFITPNLCNDTHGCSTSTGDAWLSKVVPEITASSAYQAGGTALFITWDEGAGGTAGEACATNTTDKSCHVATIVISPYTPGNTTSNSLFNHYSLLRTTEQMLGLPLLGHAADPATLSMRTGFHL